MEINKDPIIPNYGILASISWNSNKWAGEPSKEDLKSSKYDYVKDNAHMHESLNFGYDIFPVEKDGYFIGYTPMFNRLPSTTNSKNVKIIFFISSNYKNSNQKTIIGFYGFPLLGNSFKRIAKHKLFQLYNSGNIKAQPENIVFFQNPIIINNDIAKTNNLLPTGKMISQQGFNYLNSDNVYNILMSSIQLNPKNEKLRNFIAKFPLTEKIKIEEFNLKNFINPTGDFTADTVKDIEQLEEKMKGQLPEIKQRISSFIERGAISNKVKKINKYICSVCEALGEKTNSFIKPSGEPYIETHHVEPVSTIKTGVLSITNLMTVCATHHRQLHYGNTKLIENTDKRFVFDIDGKKISIGKLKIKE